MKKSIPLFCSIILLLFTSTSKSNHTNITNSIKNTITCPAAVITSFSPSSGPENTLITISGSNFNTAATVTFDGVSASFTIINDNEIEAYVPAGTSASATIAILSSGGCTGVSTTNFNVLASTCTTADIYISEIYDALTGSYAVIELYNPTNSPVVIDNIYTIVRYGEIGNITPNNTFDGITGTIAPLSTFIIQMGTGTDCPSLNVDFNIDTGINDDDEFELLKNGVLIDNVHAPAERGYTIIRNANAPIPQTTYNSADWTISSQEDCSDLDSHTADPIPDNTPNITHPTSQTTCENGSVTFTASEDSGTFNYQWKTLDASGNWVNVTNNTYYAGATTSTLTVNNIPVSFNNNQYYCEITSSSCTLITNAAQLEINAIAVDSIENQIACESYTLPTLTNGNYFTGTNGTGTPLNAGDVITTSQTIYIFNSVGNCTNQSSFTVTVTPIPTVDIIADVSVCVSYTLPTLTNGNYFTATNGAGTNLTAGDVITTTQTIYIYSAVGSCTNQSSFTVTVNGTPTVDTLANQTACESYTLPTLTNGNYFTGSNATGTALNAGDVITTSQTIYIYSEIGTAPNTCSNESSFDVSINPTPLVDTIPNMVICSEYTLPILTNGNYFTGTNGTGTALNAGDVITNSQTIYIYNSVSSCTNQTNFEITILPATDFTLSEENLTIIEDELTVNMQDTSINYIYAVDTEDYQTDNTFTNLSNGTHTLYVEDENGCITKSITFEILVVLDEIIIPNGFSPNGDAYNEWFNIQGLYGNYVNHKLEIYNRYGTLVFKGNNNNKWYGKANRGALRTNKVLPVGTYFYVLYLNDTNASKQRYTGWVYLNK
ncbi:gliding motility-associated C-terminal domain-containing protein [Lacinutrix sp. C3R15]|uniref:T9SS type B sorting domain-containing protein n=1 Tax=Flavobacteriaceae TaxID=49546 RepID=UPI001C099BED|nr:MULTISPECIES: gliding motility-associated C-terminal domain-containing protein [Flavobacteriaceae]MBU2940663.1 gliding motility-associated C-terminal domain-containing protein [Lacinutrix sp. C3R15]MDO6623981.1 gliding motility-associated C-terminal domain-containing protein [Oceanihabitans sp. 1_MG-2023]